MVSRFVLVVKALGWKADELRFDSASVLPSLRMFWSMELSGRDLILFLHDQQNSKWFSPLSISMQESFWWLQCCVRNWPPLPPPPPPHPHPSQLPTSS